LKDRLHEEIGALTKDFERLEIECSNKLQRQQQEFKDLQFQHKSHLDKAESEVKDLREKIRQLEQKDHSNF